jgi:hypothetical protein
LIAAVFVASFGVKRMFDRGNAPGALSAEPE